MNKTEWLAGLKVGDRVALVSRGVVQNVYTVVRTTSTQIILPGDTRIRRSDGYQVGGTERFGTRIEPITEEVAREIRVRVLTRRLNDTKWADLPIATLEKIMALINGAKED